MRIRVATIDDVPHLPEIERSAAQAYLVTAHADDEESVTGAEAYPPLIAAEGVHVAEVEGRLVGFVSSAPLAGGLHIYELAVQLETQRQGIGTALLAAVRHAAARHKLPALTLTTFADVPFNAPFYARQGFAILNPPPPHLAAILASEAARGWTQRCAMWSAV